MLLLLLPAWAGEHRTIPRLVGGGFRHLLTAPHQPGGRSHLRQLPQLHRDRSWEKHVFGGHPQTVPPPRYAHWCLCIVPFFLVTHFIFLFYFNRLMQSYPCPVYLFLFLSSEFSVFYLPFYRALCPPRSSIRLMPAGSSFLYSPQSWLPVALLNLPVLSFSSSSLSPAAALLPSPPSLCSYQRSLILLL